MSILNSGVNEKMIKTDKVVYRTRTLTEYDWLMDRLDEAGCAWEDGSSPIDDNYDCYEDKKNWDLSISDSHIWVKNKTISFSYPEFFYDYYKEKQDYEVIEVSDLMENEMKTDILDKLETMNEHLNNKLENLEKENDESQKIKKVVYTTEVYFE